jgi:5-deoxy-glucuronate isomerase
MTSNLLVRPHAPDAEGVVLDITPESAGWRHVGFKVLKLAPGQDAAGETAGRETCLVVLTGTVDVQAGNHVFANIGGRDSVFEDRGPFAVYAPAGTAWSVTARTPAEVAVCTAPGGPGQEPRLIDPASLSVEVRGKGTNQRYVRNILPQSEPADSLLVVEVITPGGHWSSYPPHKHDTDTPGEETQLEETYYHRIDPPQGFAFQRVYTDDGAVDETMTVQDGDVVMAPRGYHPVGAPHGYDVYYLNVMAGPKRAWVFRNDPAHDWMIRPGGARAPWGSDRS